MKKPIRSNIVLSLVFLLSAAAVSFAQVDVARRTTAITYPLNQEVRVQFRGTTRFPRMKGEAKIKRTSRNGTEIDLSVSKMPRPFELGAGYATYVLWAISPNGQVDNLGEIKRRGFFEFDSNIEVTTKLQTFALIITAEPHFLVTRPSQEIMLENLNPYTRNGTQIDTSPAVQYFGNSSDYFKDARTPEIAEIDYSKTPSTILQARQAVALAKYAGAERDATEELRNAESLLKTADDQWKAGRPESEVDISARQAVSAAVLAESTAAVRKQNREKRDEQLRSDAEIRKAESRVEDAKSENAQLREELDRERRNRELAERDAMNYSNQVRDLQAELGKLREELGRTKVQYNTAQAKLDAIAKEKQEAEDKVRREQLEAEQLELMKSLKRYGAVERSSDSVVLTLPENWWVNSRSFSLASSTRSKIGSLGQILVSHPGYHIRIESYTDDKGEQADLATLTEQRAIAIADKFAEAGIPVDRLTAKGMAAVDPVAPNTTNANRALNRRVKVILEPIVQ